MDKKNMTDIGSNALDIERGTSKELQINENNLTDGLQNLDRLSSIGHSGNRLTMLLRSSLRLSAPKKKSRVSSARSQTVPNSPNLAVIPRPLILKRIPSTGSASSLGYPFCRICHDGISDDSLGRLIAPCLCDGSLKYVHENCVQRWIEISNSKQCELCHFKYEMTSYIKPLKEWRCCPLSLGEYRKVFCFTLMYLMIQASVFWAIHALITNLTIPGISAQEYAWQFWLKIFVVLIGVSCIAVFSYVQLRYCYGMCNRWRRLNRVCVIKEPSEEKITKLRMELRSSLPCGQDDIYTSLP